MGHPVLRESPIWSLLLVHFQCILEGHYYQWYRHYQNIRSLKPPFKKAQVDTTVLRPVHFKGKYFPLLTLSNIAYMSATLHVGAGSGDRKVF